LLHETLYELQQRSAKAVITCQVSRFQSAFRFPRLVFESIDRSYLSPPDDRCVERQLTSRCAMFSRRSRSLTLQHVDDGANRPHAVSKLCVNITRPMNLNPMKPNNSFAVRLFKDTYFPTTLSGPSTIGPIGAVFILLSQFY